MYAEWSENSQSTRTLSDKSSECLVNLNWTIHKVYGSRTYVVQINLNVWQVPQSFYTPVYTILLYNYKIIINKCLIYITCFLAFLVSISSFIFQYALTLTRLMSHICDISPLHGSECVPSIMKLSKCL